MSGATRSSGRARAADPVRNVLTLVAWVELYLLAMLGCWVLLAMAATGWRPVVVTGGSMAPTVRVGDVLLIDDHPDDLLGQGSVITFEDPEGVDGLITHRIFEVRTDDGMYVTRGDANPAPDPTPVPAGQVEGVGRLVVPLIGLPVVWAQRQDVLALGSLSIVTLAALLLVTRRDRWRGPGHADLRTSAVAVTAIRRARLLVAVMISFQFLLDVGRFEVVALGLSRLQLLVVALAGLGLSDALSRRGARSGSGRGDPPQADGRRAGRWAMAELAVDTALVVLLTTATGRSGFGWVLIALPLVEAAIHFRLTGALNHWMAMTGATLTARLWVLERAGSPIGEVVVDLERLLDQLGALLLVAIPGAYLAEQLVGDVATQRRATRRAVDRGRLLEQVAEVGNEINRLGSALFETLADAAGTLGFDTADVWIRRGDGTWQWMAERRGPHLAALPVPEEAGSAMRPIDLVEPEALIDGDDPDTGEVAALADRGYRQLVRFVLSGPDGGPEQRTEVAVRAAKATATALVPGSVDALRLLCAQASVALQNDHLLAELRQLNAEIEHQASHDLLTGLPNRAHFVRRLSLTLDEAADGGPAPAVLFCDLDGFKEVNDRLGHEAGDELLVMVADRLGRCVDADDVVARLGGDEFTVLVGAATDEARAREVASRIHAALRVPFNLSGRRAEVGTSVGIALFEPGLDGGELLRRADAAMYAAKRDRASSRTVVHAAELDAGRPTRGRMVAELKKALETNALSLAYQAIVDPAGDVVGAEALLRWEHPELGPIGAERILALAESAGRVDDLNAWTLRTATSAVAELGIRDDVAFRLTVNVSSAELSAASVPANIGDALLLSGLRPDRLMVQVNEWTVAAADDLGRVAALAAGGAMLAVDDFGDGPSPTARLADLPVASVTLHPLLVQRAARSQADRIILDSVIAGGRSIGVEIVAAGIEEEIHHRVALGAGADLLQGFGLYRPVPIDRLRELLDGAGLLVPRPPQPDRGSAVRP